MISTVAAWSTAMRQEATARGPRPESARWRTSCDANSALLGSPAPEDGASVPLRWSRATSAGLAREPAPKNLSTEVSKPRTGPRSADAKIHNGSLSP